MKKSLALLYGLAAYGLFLVAFLYAVGFVGNLLVAKSIDTGPAGPLLPALAINVMLLGLFAVQHSVMARPGFKRWWTRLVPVPVERSTFVLLTSLVLLLLFWGWRPMDGVVWQVENTAGRAALALLFWAGWAVVLVSTYQIDHFDLFGLRQVILYARGRTYVPPAYQVTGFYRFVRHPLLLGFMIAFWSTPRMTVGHLVFAAVTTAYMVIAIQLEESDLRRFHGGSYEDYRRRVPMLIPRLARPAPRQAAAKARIVVAPSQLAGGSGA